MTDTELNAIAPPAIIGFKNQMLQKVKRTFLNVSYDGIPSGNSKSLLTEFLLPFPACF
jgi:hypothetical protein